MSGENVAGHRCDTGHFDRTVCPEPCGRMHSYCTTCGERHDDCAHDPAALSEVAAGKGPKWADLFGAAPGINLTGEPSEVTLPELTAIVRNAVALGDPAASARWMQAHLHITRRADA